MDEEILKLYPDSVLNSRLRDHWRMFKSKNIGYVITINENILYQWCIAKKILAFAYALVECSDGNMYSIFNVLEGENSKSMSDLLSHHYQLVQTIDPKVFNVPMFKFLPRKLELHVNATKDGVGCTVCKNGKYLYDDQCLNIKCTAFKLPSTKHLTNDGAIQLSMDYVQRNVGVLPSLLQSKPSKNSSVLSQVDVSTVNNVVSSTTGRLEGCLQCLKCKLCSRNNYIKKCKRHIVCTHVKKKQIRSDFRKFLTNS